MGPHCLSLYLTLLIKLAKICNRQQMQMEFSDDLLLEF